MTTPTPERVCPACGASLSRYEDPVAIKIISKLEQERDALKIEYESRAIWISKMLPIWEKAMADAERLLKKLGK